jgi:hypothetical protein
MRIVVSTLTTSEAVEADLAIEPEMRPTCKKKERNFIKLFGICLCFMTKKITL